MNNEVLIKLKIPKISVVVECENNWCISAGASYSLKK